MTTNIAKFSMGPKAGVKSLWFLCTLLGALLPALAQAQLSERFGPYELHYSVVNTTFLDPSVATQYDIARGKRRAILNLSLRKHLGDGQTEAREMILTGESWDLTERRINFDFQEVREGPAIYYIGQFKFLNEEFRFFNVTFTASDDTEQYSFKFRHQMYAND